MSATVDTLVRLLGEACDANEILKREIDILNGQRIQSAEKPFSLDEAECLVGLARMNRLCMIKAIRQLSGASLEEARNSADRILVREVSARGGAE